MQPTIANAFLSSTCSSFPLCEGQEGNDRHPSLIASAIIGHFLKFSVLRVRNKQTNKLTIKVISSKKVTTVISAVWDQRFNSYSTKNEFS